MGLSRAVLSQCATPRPFPGDIWLSLVGVAGNTARKIDKIKKPFLHMFLPHFQQLYKPSHNLSINETMVGFGGGLAQCHKSQPSGV